MDYIQTILRATGKSEGMQRLRELRSSGSSEMTERLPVGRGSTWQRKVESTPFPFLALHPNPATVLFNEFLAKEQSQTAAGFIIGALAVRYNIEPE